MSIPQSETPSEEDTIQVTKTQVKNTVSGTKAKTTDKSQANAKLEKSSTKSSFVTALDNFQVNLKNFRLRQLPLYDFRLEGGLTLNGTIDNTENIIPQGKLLLTRANIDLFSNSFNLARNRQNTINFTPEAGIFNPRLDIVLRTPVENINQQDFNKFRLADTNSNELDDPISAINNSQTFRVNLVIDGYTAEILPNLGQTTSLNCNIRSNSEPLVENERYYSQEELNRFTRCFNKNAYDVASDRNIINSPAVELTSTPSLNQGEIINLLSGQFIAFAEEFSNLSQAELFDKGVNRFILTPLTNRFLFAVEDTTVKWGKEIGLDYLTVFPNLEGIVEINQKSSVRSTFNYVLNETRVEYQRKF